MVSMISSICQPSSSSFATSYTAEVFLLGVILPLFLAFFTRLEGFVKEADKLASSEVRSMVPGVKFYLLELKGLGPIIKLLLRIVLQFFEACLDFLPCLFLWIAYNLSSISIILGLGTHGFGGAFSSSFITLNYLIYASRKLSAKFTTLLFCSSQQFKCSTNSSCSSSALVIPIGFSRQHYFQLNICCASFRSFCSGRVTRLLLTTALNFCLNIFF